MHLINCHQGSRDLKAAGDRRTPAICETTQSCFLLPNAPHPLVEEVPSILTTLTTCVPGTLKVLATPCPCLAM